MTVSNCTFVMTLSMNLTHIIMHIIGLIWELTLLGIAVYFYLYMTGYLKGKTKEQQRKIDEFRQNNGWLKYASMLLGAIMIINLYIRLTGFGSH